MLTSPAACHLLLDTVADTRVDDLMELGDLAP